MTVYEMADTFEAIKIICSHARKSFRELVTIQDAVERYSCDNIRVPFDYPLWRRSRMDGFACGSGSDFSKEFSIVADISAADKFDKKLLLGECVRIATGSKVPEGADIIIKLEDSNETPTGVFLHRYPDAVYNIEESGSLLKAGEVLISENTQIDHRHIEALATLRINTVYVKNLSRIGILSTGSEITSRFSKDEMTINSNYYALSSLLRVFGVPYASLGVCPDDKGKLMELISSGIDGFDAFISFGGTAFSRYDLMKEVLRSLGGEVIIDGLNASPGKTFRFGIIRDKPFFIFPGTPQAATLCGELFLVSWLRASVKTKNEFFESELGFDINKKVGFYKLVPCFSKIENAKLVSYERVDASDTSYCFRSVVLVPPEIANLKAGNLVKTFIVY